MSQAHDHSIEPHVEEDMSPASESAGDSVTVPVSYVPLKAADVLELDMGDGVILYNHDSNLVHHLNPSAAILWQLCDGDATVAQLAKEISEEYGLPGETVQAEVVSLVAEMDALGLLQDGAGPSAT